VVSEELQGPVEERLGDVRTDDIPPELAYPLVVERRGGREVVPLVALVRAAADDQLDGRELADQPLAAVIVERAIDGEMGERIDADLLAASRGENGACRRRARGRNVTPPPVKSRARSSPASAISAKRPSCYLVNPAVMSSPGAPVRGGGTPGPGGTGAPEAW
jgi:hypothetical protein